MKTLQRYIKEDFKISQNTRKFGSVHVEDQYELREIIEKRYKQNEKHLDLCDIDVSNLPDLSLDWRQHFRAGIYGLFQDMINTETINITGWNTHRVIKMSNMFRDCKNLREIKGLEYLNVQYVIDLFCMFAGCESLKTIDLSNWDLPKINSINSMFHGCISLTSVTGISDWDLSKCVNIHRLFYDCPRLENIDNIDNWDVKHLYDGGGIKNRCSQVFLNCVSLQYRPTWYEDKQYDTINVHGEETHLHKI